MVKEHGTPENKDAPAQDVEIDEFDDDSDAFPAWPDIILIDGGQGQMSAVRGILQRDGSLPTRSLPSASRRAWTAMRDANASSWKASQPFTLPPRDPVLYFLQRLRDEAHRFAIGTHRAKRKKEMVKNPLDEIAGIGPSRKRALLHQFGTAKAVSRAAVEDLMKVDGISEAMAITIRDHFRTWKETGRSELALLSDIIAPDSAIDVLDVRCLKPL